MVLLAVTLVGYTALHCIHPQWFYKNHFKRGFGPEPPATAGASGAWAWVVLVARMPLDEIERHAGSDARVLLEFIALAMKTYGALYCRFDVYSEFFAYTAAASNLFLERLPPCILLGTSR